MKEEFFLDKMIVYVFGFYRNFYVFYFCNFFKK